MWEMFKKFFGAEIAKLVEAALSEEQQKEMKEKLGENGKIVITDGKSWIPKSRLDEVISERDKLKSQIDLKDKQIEDTKKTLDDLKKSAEGSDDLTSKLEEANNKIDEMQNNHAEGMKNLHVDNAIGLALRDAKVAHPDLLVNKFDRTKLLISDDGKIVSGIKEQMEVIKENYKDLFPVEKPVGDSPAGGGTTVIPLSELRNAHDKALKEGKTGEAVTLKRKIFEAEQEAKNK